MLIFTRKTSKIRLNNIKRCQTLNTLVYIYLSGWYLYYPERSIFGLDICLGYSKKKLNHWGLFIWWTWTHSSGKKNERERIHFIHERSKQSIISICKFKCLQNKWLRQIYIIQYYGLELTASSVWFQLELHIQ